MEITMKIKVVNLRQLQRAECGFYLRVNSILVFGPE